MQLKHRPMYLYGLADLQNVNWGQTFVGFTLQRSQESIKVFDKMLERKLTNFISDLTILLIIFVCSVFSSGLEMVKFGKVY